MPRRSRRDEEPARRRRGPSGPPPPGVEEIAARITGGPGLAVEGFEARSVTGERRYRCPYCQGWVEPGTPHVVAFPAGEPAQRRHYHTGCWSKDRGASR